MANRFIIGRGELLTYDILPPSIKPTKSHPYTLDQAKEAVIPQIRKAAVVMKELPQEACPQDVSVAQLDLHPAYISKSYFPQALLRQAGLTSIGSRNVVVRPRKRHSKAAPEESETTRLFIAGTRSAFAKLPDFAIALQPETKEAENFAEIESFSAMTVTDRVRPSPSGQEIFEIGVHLLPDEQLEATRSAFRRYAKSCDFEIHPELEFPVGRMIFFAARGEKRNLNRLAMFSLVRVVRPMAKMRGSRPIPRGTGTLVDFMLPASQPLADEPRVAILDGGLPAKHPLTRFVKKYEKSDPRAADVPAYLDHGLAVTSAFLFGPIEPEEEAVRPYTPVDVFRVLDSKSDKEDRYELFRTMGHVEEILLTRQYQFLNISLGPEAIVEDNDVHAWTSMLDTMLSDGETIVTVAVGNNGAGDKALQQDRLQVPSDSVNAISVGAANRSRASWQRASYSARGPGRSPGRRKPDVVVFGGSPKEYFHVAAPGTRPQLVATFGTSFASPYLLRSCVGVRAVLGDQVHPLTAKALVVHAAENEDGLHPDDVGWGRVPSDLNAIISCGVGVARIIYQGTLRPGKLLRAPLPLPTKALAGNIEITATFCYASPVDVADAATYTKAGLTIRFRPNSDRKTKGKKPEAATNSFFSQGEFRTEKQLRADLGKWETVLHAKATKRGSSLKEPCFDIHYNARDGGGPTGSGAEIIRYSLVLTVHAPRHVDIYDEILRSHAKLQALAPRVALPIRA